MRTVQMIMEKHTVAKAENDLTHQNTGSNPEQVNQNTQILIKVVQTYNVYIMEIEEQFTFKKSLGVKLSKQVHTPHTSKANSSTFLEASTQSLRVPPGT